MRAAATTSPPPHKSTPDPNQPNSIRSFLPSLPPLLEHPQNNSKKFKNEPRASTNSRRPSGCPRTSAISSQIQTRHNTTRNLSLPCPLGWERPQINNWIFFSHVVHVSEPITNHRRLSECSRGLEQYSHKSQPNPTRPSPPLLETP